MEELVKCDYLVVGSGIAGLSFALRCAEFGTVVVVTKKNDMDTATNLAQGGIAAVLESSDSIDSHVEDTLVAGAGLCDEEVVKMVVENGPERISDLVAQGVDFVNDKNSSSGYSLGREGGHSHRRVAHSYDLTGHEIERALLEKIATNEKIKLCEEHVVVDLLMVDGDVDGFVGETGKKCVGAYVMSNGVIKPYRAKMTALCSGGVGKVYLYTTNPDIATGDGVAMAYRAGAVIQNMEFIQFHPTCLFHPLEKNFLISEAVRGEGGVLIDKSGVPFMGKYDKRKDLATRDTVARAIDKELKESGEDCVYLDITHKEEGFLKERFPTIYQRCLSRGIDITKTPIPVVPAAHYMCGGVKTDKTGRSSVPGLLVLGETACTGLHGGNRLASNSLLEAVVFAHNAANFCGEISKKQQQKDHEKVDEWKSGNARKLSEEILINHNWDSIRRVMWDYVGIVRSTQRLKLAKKRMEFIYDEIENHYRKYNVTTNMLELRNISMVALLIIQSAMLRKESRGLHYLIDYPKKLEKTNQTIFHRKRSGKSMEIEITKYP